MQRIDRYIARRFFQFFALALLAALAIYLVIDPIENLDKFLDRDVPTSEIIRYYALFVPYIIYLTYPVAILLATMFCIGGLTASNEIMAMTASGVPLYRHLFSLSLLGLVLSVLTFWWGETIVPEMNRERLAIWREKVKNRADWRLTEQGQVYLQDGLNRVLHLDLYQPESMQGFGIDLYRFQDARIIERTTAKTMNWNGEGWTLHEAVIRRFSENGEDIEHLDSLEAGIKIVPSDMVELKIEPEEMGLAELHRFVKRLRQTGGNVNRWLVDIHSKVALPFAGVIIIVFGVPISAVRRRSGVVFGVTLCLLISFIYFGLMQIGKVLGYKELLHPFLAAWLGNLVFFIIGLALLHRAPK